MRSERRCSFRIVQLPFERLCTRGRRGRPRVLPSAPVVGFRRRQASCEWVVACQQAVGDRDLTPAVDAELLTQDVAMRLRGARRDAERVADLLVRQSLRDQFDHLTLPWRDGGGISQCLHAVTVSSSGSEQHSPKGVFPWLAEQRRYAAPAATLRPRNEASWPRSLAASAPSSSSAPIRSSSSNSSRKCVRIISGPSVAIVNGTLCSANVRSVSRTAASSGSAF